jgi:N-acetylneuraminate synthase/N,N'-diacetyllegionaminate synthase
VGLSDHTTSTLTGALAVAAGATIVEKHIRLHDTSQDCPDYPHSLCANEWSGPVGDVSLHHFNTFKQYVSNIREAERAL